MPRYYGIVGYSEAGEFKDGVYEETRIVERYYRGEVQRNSRWLQNGSSILPDLSVNVSISIVADAYANEHINDIKYIEWQGVKWTVVSIDVQRPRLIFDLGGVYNGPTT